MHVRSDDADIFYEVRGSGAPLVFLHPFPATHEFWLPVAEQLSARYRVVLPDLRGHGESSAGEGPATMAKHAEDVARVCDECKIGRAVFAGCSIGGYILFELWRRHRERVSALVLCNTKAEADSAEASQARLQSARDVMERGPEWFIDSMMPKLVGDTTRTARPDIADAARRMMLQNTAAGISAVQQGMAERPDSIPTLATIDVPTLVLGGDEDKGTPLEQAEQIRKGIRGSELKVISKAGHYAAFEHPQDATGLIREFLSKLRSS
jgi:3-oxoadipate enol-lactonase